MAYQDFATELATLLGKYAPPAGELLLACDPEGRALELCCARAARARRLLRAEAALCRARSQGHGPRQGVAGCRAQDGGAPRLPRIRLDTLPDMSCNADPVPAGRLRADRTLLRRPWPGRGSSGCAWRQEPLARCRWCRRWGSRCVPVAGWFALRWAWPSGSTRRPGLERARARSWPTSLPRHRTDQDRAGTGWSRAPAAPARRQPGRCDPLPDPAAEVEERWVPVGCEHRQGGDVTGGTERAAYGICAGDGGSRPSAERRPASRMRNPDAGGFAAGNTHAAWPVAAAALARILRRRRARDLDRSGAWCAAAAQLTPATGKHSTRRCRARARPRPARIAPARHLLRRRPKEVCAGGAAPAGS